MKLKQIQIQGFKSFLNRTVINFTDNITVIVGPNGCGKSNVVDSIRWVMGEQSAKHLRGESMEDVIFHGTEDTGAVGMAEVVLTFDNTGGSAPGEYARFSEIQVARRLFRSGESEYYINRTPCRLKDITDLFLGSGASTKAYSIIEQGRIEAIITMKPEQRRSLIEEAAGVSKYRARKVEAERKMEYTRQNLLRLRDIIAELTRQMNSLNRQAKKAERYKKYRDELKVIELELASHRAREIRANQDKTSSHLAGLHERGQELSGQLEVMEATLESKKAGLAVMEGSLSELQKTIVDASREVERAENVLAMLEQEKKNLEQSLSRLSSEEGELRARDKSMESESADLTREISSLSESFESERSKLEAAGHGKVEKEKEYSELSRAAGELERGVSSLLAGIEKMKERIEWARKRGVELAEKKSGLGSRIESLEESLESKARSNLGYNEKLYQIKKELSELSRTHGTMTAELGEAKTLRAVVASRLTEVDREQQRLSSRLDSLREMERNFEGYQRGVKSIMERKAELEAQGKNGTYGLITDSIKVDKEYELALEAVLGDKLQSIVVKNRSHGIDNIKFLQERQAGKSSFVPRSEIRRVPVEIPSALARTGAQALADKVSAEGDLQELVGGIIGNALVVDDLEAAAELRELNNLTTPLVTRDGVLIDERGVITGGSQDAFSGFLSKKREMEELEGRLSALSEKRAETAAELAALDEKISTATKSCDELREKLHRREIDKNNVEKDLRQGTDTYNRIKQEMESLGQEIGRAEDSIRSLGEEIDRNNESIGRDMASRAEREAELSRLRGRLDILRSERETVTERYTGAQVKVAALQEKLEAQKKQLARLVRAREEIAAGLAKRRQEKERIEERMSALSGESSTADEKKLEASLRSKQRRDLMDERRSAYQAESEAVRTMEGALKGLYREREALKDQIMEAELLQTELKMKWEGLAETVRDKYMRELDEVMDSHPEPADGYPVDERREAREQLKDKLERMGEVNLTAIEEFEEISQRHSFLSNQEADLIQALENLELAIAKINSAYRRAFKKTYDEVNAKFQEIFPRLFNGGKAELALTNNDDLLAAGVEILAQPPGKKMNYIALLSGGEKALTASALILALFNVRPSPFCLLDEVDAALDDVNVARFNEHVQELAANSQLIIITHNRRTMEIANAIYGVTMEQKGVSKLVSVRFKEDKGPDAVAANS